MSEITRRRFLGSTAVATFVPSTVFGASAPSEKIVMGCIGTGGQGTGNMRQFLGRGDVRVVSVCDVDIKHRNRAVGIVNSRYGNKDCTSCNDFRELLDNSDIDAVTVCTPDHWHGLISIEAARTGKDIYCEKPLTNTISEGRALVDSVRRCGVVLQTGSHERSRPNARMACELVRNGVLGKIHTIQINLPCTQGHHLRILNDKTVYKPMPVPEGFDYDMWLGPTPRIPYVKHRTHFSWRFVMDYGGGEMTDRGAHVIDLGQLGNGTDDTTPVSYRATGVMPKSNVWNTFFNYNFECKYAGGVRMIGTSQEPRGVKFIGPEGWIFIHVHGGNLEASSPDLLRQKISASGIHLERSPGHHANFIDCVKSRKRPFADVEIGHHTATICHLLNASMEMGGREFTWEPEKELSDDELVNRFIARAMRSPWSLQ